MRDREKVGESSVVKYFLFSFEFSQKEFVDLCILLGCDYADKIKGIGPKKAIELVLLFS